MEGLVQLFFDKFHIIPP